MIGHLASLALVVGVLGLLRVFAVIERSRQSLEITRKAFAVLRDRDLDDEEKERVMQSNSLTLLKHAGVLIGLGGLALALPVGAVALLAMTGTVSMDEVIERTLSWPYLAFGMVAGYLMLRPPKQASSYSRLDRWLHRFAFATRRAQAASADLEHTLYAKELAAMKPTPPVLVTGLPRSGTTLLLEALAGLPEFATHTYRDMPFVLTPCLWQRLSIPFQRSAGGKPRAHGDGMQIDFDSPEAFEEILWMTFYSGHYRTDRIEPWGEEVDPEFADFLRLHQLKIRWLRRGRQPSRYLSKNNANISRLAAWRKLEPAATLIVPFRDPVQHALSLQRQHLRFLDIHRDDRFAARYMAGIGHYEFGANLRPIDFDGWVSSSEWSPADGLNFWLAYWIAAYRHLLNAAESAERLFWIDYDRLCEAPEPCLTALADRLDLSDESRRRLLAFEIRPARSHDVDASELDRKLLSQAGELHRELSDQARRSDK